MRFLITLLTAATVAFAAPALAEPTAGGDHAPAEAHGGDAHGDAHGGDAHGDAHGDDAHGDDHGEGHGDHYYYSGDDDHDGVPNWRDAMNGDEPNTHYVLTGIGFHAFNLMLLIALFYFVARRPINDALRGRALGIRKELTDSAKERDEARERHDEVVARLAKLEDEIAEMHAKARADAEAEKAKLIERAKAEAVRIGEAAERNIRDEVARARDQLRRDAVALAVELAEENLKEQVNSDDQQRLARAFLDTLNQDGGSANV